MLRTALKPRWLGLFALLLAILAACVQLGLWQLHVAQDKGLAASLAKKAYLGRTFAWEADLEKRALALDAASIRAALAKYLVAAKFTTISAGDFASPPPAPPPPAK